MNVKVDISNVILETPNLILRPFKQEDLNDFYEYASVPGVGEMAGWPHHKNIEITKIILEEFIMNKNQFALVYKNNNKVIGSLGIEEYPLEIYKQFSRKRVREIGYVLSYDYWHKGLMSEAVSRVIEYLFTELKLDFITVSHFVENSRSERVIKRNGFSYFCDAPYKDTDKLCKYYYKHNPNRMNMLEVCCGSYEDALEAYKAGAKRIELNSALYLGGLSPNGAIVKLLKEKTNLNIVSMVRPRGTGFCYTEAEIIEMFEVAKNLLDSGTDAIAFGFLTKNSEIDSENTKKMVDLIHSYGKKAVFHRAIDVVSDYYSSVEMLCRLGVDRILTSGMANKAVEGLDVLASLYKKFGASIEIVAASGVNENNVNDILATGIYQIHSSCKGFKKDTTSTNNGVSYNYLDDEKYEVVSKDKVEAILNKL